MFSTVPEKVIARKKHRCTYCAEPIPPKTSYSRWKSLDDYWFTSKMHPECFDDYLACVDLSEDGTYTPFDNERPPQEVK